MQAYAQAAFTHCLQSITTTNLTHSDLLAAEAAVYLAHLTEAEKNLFLAPDGSGGFASDTANGAKQVPNLACVVELAGSAHSQNLSECFVISPSCC